MDTLLVSTKEIAARYSVHPKTVLKWVRAKILPVVRINKRCIRFNVTACDKIMNHRTSLSPNLVLA
jgi:predicted site-specific integrase-resolvase